MKMKAFAPILLLLFVFLSTHSAISASPRHTQMEVELVQGGHSFEVGVVLGPSLAPHSLLFRQIVVESFEKVRRITGLNFEDPFWIFFDSEPDFHNGFATVIPSDWIRVHTAAPDADSSIGFSQDYILDTLVHEMAHMIVLQQRRGLFRFLSWIFGNASRPIGTWPRWVHEGTAVWVESFLGGRVGSGYVEYEKRKFADYYYRFKKYPLENYHMDGNFVSQKTSKGQIPYHFGYLIYEKIFGKSNALFSKFVTDSSYSLGLSFQSRFRDQGIDIDQVFNQVREDALKTVKSSQINENRTTISGADVILGPYSNYVDVSWIEIDEDKNETAVYKKGDELIKVAFKHPHSNLLQIFHEKDYWLALVREVPKDTNHQVERKIIRFNEKLKKSCEFNIEGNIREFTQRMGQLAWVTENKDGEFKVYRASFKNDCSLSQPILLGRSWSEFERISFPSFDHRGKLYFSRSQGRNSFLERVQDEDKNFYSSNVTLSNPLPLRSSFCSHSKECLIVFERSKQYWGPLLVLPNGKSYRTNKLSTGADAAVLVGNRDLYVKQQMWSGDRILRLVAEDFQDQGSVIKRAKDDLSLKAEHERSLRDQSLESKGYSALSTFWPRFWLPELYFYDKGFVAGGSSFFNDITERYFGALSLGYDSYSLRPYANGSFWKERLHLGPFSSASVGAYYSPAVIASSVQDRWGASFVAAWRARFGAKWNAVFRPGVQYIEAKGSGALASYRYFAPVVSVGLASSKAKNPDHAAFRISESKLSFQLKQRTRFLSDFELYQRAVFQSDLPFKTGFQASLEHGVTRLSNFPASYFEMGGQALFSTRDPTFMTRGYASRLIVAKQAARAGVEFGFKIAEDIYTAKWNRFRVDDLETSLVAETASFDSFSKASRFRMGRQYFSTVGMKWDFYGQIFHYSNYRMSFGMFKGFGEFGQWSANLSLRSYLDIL